jgi:hypothetical protein
MQETKSIRKRFRIFERSASKLLALPLLLLCVVILNLPLLSGYRNNLSQIQAQDFSISPTTVESVLRSQEDLLIESNISNPFQTSLVFEISISQDIKENLAQVGLEVDFSLNDSEFKELDTNPQIIEIPANSDSDLAFRLKPTQAKDYQILIPVNLDFAESNTQSITSRQNTIRLNIVSNIQSNQQEQQTQIYIAAGLITLSLIVILGIGVSSIFEARRESDNG